MGAIFWLQLTGIISPLVFLQRTDGLSSFRWNPSLKCCTRSVRQSPLMMSSTPMDECSTLQKQEQKLLQRGCVEAALMAHLESPILVQEDTSHAETLRQQGVVRIDQVIPDHVADTMHAYVYDLLSRSQEAISRGHLFDPTDRFAPVLLHSQRCDLKLPLGPPQVQSALTELLLHSPVRQTLETLVGTNAILYELSCLISDPGSQRQNVHPDHPCLSFDNSNSPQVVTCFVALQDIDMTMGPTIWLPRTHHPSVHERFQSLRVECLLDSPESPKDRLLRTTPSVVGVMPKGSCVMFDSRILHCGSANSVMSFGSTDTPILVVPK